MKKIFDNPRFLKSVIAILLAVFLMSVLLCSFVNAQIAPLPIVGQIKNFGGDVLILVTNLRTGVQMETTSVEGYYLIEWANSDTKGGSVSRYANGDQFKIEVVACSPNPACIQTATYSSIQGEVKADFDLFEAPITSTTIIETTTIETTTSIPTTTTIPVTYDWTTFIQGGGVIAFLLFLATAYGAYKRRIRIQYYKKYWNETSKRWSYKWVTIFQRSD